MTRRASAQSRTISAGGAIVVSPENATCSLWSERATTHPLERPPLWPALRRPRLAGFEVSTEVPPGRERDSTRPVAAASPLDAMTIGILVVIRFAAATAGV